MKPAILIIDDERNIRRTLGLILAGAGYETREAATLAEGRASVEETAPDLVLLDVRLPDGDGLDLMREIAAPRPAPPVIMISGHATVSLAVEATRAGAFDFLEKPLSKERVLIAVRNALRVGELSERVGRYEGSEARRQMLVGASPALERLREQIRKAGPASATVLILGESGTGKELVARALHDASPRREGPFVKTNCAAIPEDLIESELFGSVRGAYTGADRTRDGKFLLADGGTIFLDEIGDMSLRVQAKVLRALQEGEIERVGDTRLQHVDVRVVAATNRDLQADVRSGRFREDLFFRLNVVPLRVPPLRERNEDVPLLVEHFLALYAAENDLPRRRLEPPAIEVLQRRAWRGNIRELRNLIERLAILSDGEVITREDLRRLGGGEEELPAGALDPSSASRSIGVAGLGWKPDPELIRGQGGLFEARKQFEIACIEAALDRTGGNVSEAARLLGIERSNLHKKMAAFGLEARPARPGAAIPPEDSDD